jgi:hypothetical protein
MLVGSKILYEEISSMDFPQHGEVFYFYGQALCMYVRIIKITPEMDCDQMVKGWSPVTSAVFLITKSFW